MDLRFRHLFTTRRTLGRVFDRRLQALLTKQVPASRHRRIHVRLQTHRALPPRALARPLARIHRPRARIDASVRQNLRAPFRPRASSRRLEPRAASVPPRRSRQDDRSRVPRLANDDDVADRSSSLLRRGRRRCPRRPSPRRRRRRRRARVVLAVAHEHHRALASSRRARAPVRPAPARARVVVDREIDRDRATATAVRHGAPRRGAQ